MKKVLLMVVVVFGILFTGCTNDPADSLDRRSKYQSIKDINNKLISHDRIELSELDSLESLLERIKEVRIAEVGEKQFDDSGEGYQYSRAKMNIIIIRNLRNQGK